MAKYAYVATGPDGQVVTGVEGAGNREAAELVLYGRDLRGIRLTEKKSVLKAELTALGGSAVPPAVIVPVPAPLVVPLPKP